MKDFWIATLSDGRTVEENWVSGELSPWIRLMNDCKKNHVYVSNLRLSMAEETYTLPMNAEGYWQSHAMPSVQGIDCDEELHKWRGIGAVHQGIVHIIWAARDPQTHQLCAWEERRSAHDQNQIIWGHNAGIGALVVPDGIARPMEKFTDKVLGAANS